MESGVLTKSARVGIHTSRPTPQDLTRRLIEKYPKLRDTVDNGYVSHCCYCILYTILLQVSTHFFRVLGEVNCGLSSKLVPTQTNAHGTGEAWNVLRLIYLYNFIRPAGRAGTARAAIESTINNNKFIIFYRGIHLYIQ